jgi:hypothetical protein
MSYILASIFLHIEWRTHVKAAHVITNRGRVKADCVTISHASFEAARSTSPKTPAVKTNAVSESFKGSVSSHGSSSFSTT